ncbi:MAG: hypothetical protein HRT80_03340 [Henriciella sp.]|nr:hypothetical protein [Henriciella sp.]
MRMMLSLEALQRASPDGVAALLDQFIENGGTYIHVLAPMADETSSLSDASILQAVSDWLSTHLDSNPKVFCTISKKERLRDSDGYSSSANLLTKTELIRGDVFDALYGVLFGLEKGEGEPQSALEQATEALKYLHASGLLIGLRSLNGDEPLTEFIHESGLDYIPYLELSAEPYTQISQHLDLNPKRKFIFHIPHLSMLSEPGFENSLDVLKNFSFAWSYAPTSAMELERFITWFASISITNAPPEPVAEDAVASKLR